MFLLSLPMRERGLKWVVYDDFEGRAMSLPMRERGLKSVGTSSNPSAS